jgi:hypothetical protein
MKLTNRLLGYPQSLPTEMAAKEIEAAFDPADEGPVLLHRMSPILAHRYQSRRCNIWGQALSDYPPPHVDVARGLVLLFGIGTKALPSWGSKTRRNNLLGGLAVRRTADPSDQANSPHPSSREGHHATTRWSSSFLL